jgi:hypothetical protein
MVATTDSDFRNVAARLTLVNMRHLYLHKHLDGREAADQTGREFAHVREACASAVRRMPAALISHNAEPIGHISPYPRIDLSPVRTESAKPSPGWIKPSPGCDGGEQTHCGGRTHVAARRAGCGRKAFAFSWIEVMKATGPPFEAAAAELQRSLKADSRVPSIPILAFHPCADQLRPLQPKPLRLRRARRGRGFHWRPAHEKLRFLNWL